jgi:precorrin-6A/cobalt-precorrin-6A reductase
MRVLVLGGSSEASGLARSLAGRTDIEATLSLAGRTANPTPSPLPTRIGGFRGMDGLIRYIRVEGVDAIVDATHPFAAQMKRQAVEACAAAGTPLAAFSRPVWTASPGDRWIEVDDADAAARALGETPKRVFLTTGRLRASAFAGSSPHHFVLRSIDAPAPESAPASVEVVLARGPFSIRDEIELMTTRRIDVVVSKNSGGDATRAKIDAARELGLPVIMIRRPPAPVRVVFEDLDGVLGWLEAQRSAP